jgi:di/tripeptidase
VGDNAASLGILLQVVGRIRQLPLSGELLVAASVGEEGVGDLRGMRVLMDRHAGEVDAVIAVDGRLGGVVTQGVGSVRYRIEARGPGGHSWGDFGRPSAVHELARVVARLSRMKVRRRPRTTFNVGVFRGGTSINTIADAAMAEVDLRSTDAKALERLQTQFHDLLKDADMPAGITLHTEQIGSRPVGRISNDHWLPQLAHSALESVNVNGVFIASSTDANIALSRGVPAICFGVYRGSGAHTMRERVDIASLVPGAKALTMLLTQALSTDAAKASD